jgi:hypothetical protein
MCFYNRYLKIIPKTTVPTNVLMCRRCLTKISISYSLLCVDCNREDNNTVVIK